jgi:hypothetical protein
MTEDEAAEYANEIIERVNDAGGSTEVFIDRLQIIADEIDIAIKASKEDLGL